MGNTLYTPLVCDAVSSLEGTRYRRSTTAFQIQIQIQIQILNLIHGLASCYRCAVVVVVVALVDRYNSSATVVPVL